MTPEQWMLLVGVVSAVVFGPLTARSTEKRDKIYGGTLAKALNMVVCALMAAAPLVVLAGFFTGFGLRVIVVGLTIIGIGLLVSVVYGAVEHPARERAPKRSIIDSWTEKDARTSGL